MGAVVRAHIRIESILFSVVEELSPNPQHLRKLGLDYDGYVTLALVLGLSEHLGPPFRALGKLRNDFAHKADFSLNQSSVTNLYTALSGSDKAHVQSMFDRIKGDNEETAGKKYSELEPMDQFKLIAVTLWAAAQAALINVRQLKAGA